MSATDISLFIPKDQYDALLAANAPTQLNPFATIADLAGLDANWGNANLILDANRTHNAATFSITENNVGGYTTNLTASTERRINWSDGTGTPTTVVMGAGLNATGFESAGAAGAYLSTPAEKAYSAVYDFGNQGYVQSTVYDTNFAVDEAGFFARPAVGGGNFTAAQLYHFEYGTGNYYGFEANVFGERILSQSAGLNRLSALDVAAGMAFLSGSGGTGYIGVVDQTGLASWLGISSFSPTLADVLANGNTTGANDINITEGQSIIWNTAAGGPFTGTLSNATLTGNHTWDLPSQSGVIALVSDIPAPDGNGIYTGSGTVPNNITATLSPRMSWANVDRVTYVGDVAGAATNDHWYQWSDAKIGISLGLNATGGQMNFYDYATSTSMVQFTATSNNYINTAGGFQVGTTLAALNSVVTIKGRDDLVNNYGLIIRNDSDVNYALFRNSGRVDLGANGGQVNLANPVITTSNVNVRETLGIWANSATQALVQANNSAGGSQIQANATGGAAGFVITTNTANFDSTVSYRHIGTTRVIHGYDSSANYFSMGTTGLSSGNFFIHDFGVNRLRLPTNVGIGGTFGEAATRLVVRGTTNDSTGYGLKVQRLNGLQILGMRNDGLLQVNTTLTQTSGLGGTSTTRGLISEFTSTSQAAEIEQTFSARLISNPGADSTVRARGARIVNSKIGNFRVRETIGLSSEAFNVGSASYTFNAIDGLTGFIAQAANQYSGDITINQMWGLKTQTFNSTAGGTSTATVTDFGGIWVQFDNSTRLTATRMVGVRIGDPSNTTGAVITESRALWIESNTLGTTNYGIYQQGAGMINAMQGTTVVGALAASGSAALQVTGEMELFGNGAAFYMYSADGTQWTITMDNSGSFVIV